MIVEMIQSIDSDEEREAVNRIYELYHKYMWAKALGILKNEEDARDAVQETFVKITCNVKAFMNPESNDTAALVSIYTKNVALNMYKRKKKQWSVFDMSEDIHDMSIPNDPWDNIEELVISNETTELVRQAIDELDDMYRDVIMLKYYYHMKNIEIADLLGVDANIVNGRIFRAKKMLREILGRKGYERITNR